MGKAPAAQEVAGLPARTDTGPAVTPGKAQLWGSWEGTGQDDSTQSGQPVSFRTPLWAGSWGSDTLGMSTPMCPVTVPVPQEGRSDAC